MLTAPVSIQCFAAPIDLQPFVKDFIFIKDDRSNDAPPERLMPDGNFMLVLNLENGYTAANGDQQYAAEKSGMGYLHGHASGAFYLSKSAAYQGIALHFTPEGLYHLLRTSLQELPLDGIFTTEELLGKWGKDLVVRLQEQATTSQQIACLETLLRQKFRPVLSTEAGMMPVLSWIEQHKGMTTVQDLAATFCMSRKTLERRFQQRVGLPPKQYLRTIRFRHAYTRLCMGDFSAMMDLVVEHGYFDQMHMIKEFKQMVGRTPAELLKSADFQEQFYHLAYRKMEHSALLI